MTKEITKAYILQQLQDKLGLREFDPANFLFAETVVPTYEIAEHLRTQRAQREVISVTSIGGITFYTVPDDEKWFLNGYTVIFTGAGAIKISGMYVIRRSEAAAFCYLDLTKNIAISYTHLLPYPFPLEHGDRIGLNCDDYVSTQNLELHIDYTEEKMR